MDFRSEYRIVKDGYLGFAAEFRPWWSFSWRECYVCNTQDTVEKAEFIATCHARGGVKLLGRLP